MVGAIPSPEVSNPYEYDRQQVDETLLNARDLLVRYVDNAPRLPIGEDEQFDPAVHSYYTPYDSMSTEEREISKAALTILADRYTEISSQIGPILWRDPVAQVREMLGEVQTVWLSQYLQVRADQVGHLEFTDWVEWVLRYHPNYTILDEGNESVTPYYPVYRAHDNLAINVRRGKDKFHLPGVIIVPPGVTVTAQEESECYVARWDDIGTDVRLDVPVDRYVRRELEGRGLLRDDSPTLDARAAEVGNTVTPRSISN